MPTDVLIYRCLISKLTEKAKKKRVAITSSGAAFGICINWPKTKKKKGRQKSGETIESQMKRDETRRGNEIGAFFVTGDVFPAFRAEKSSIMSDVNPGVTDVQSNWMLQFVWPATSQFGVTCPRRKLPTKQQLALRSLSNRF